MPTARSRKRAPARGSRSPKKRSTKPSTRRPRRSGKPRKRGTSARTRRQRWRMGWAVAAAVVVAGLGWYGGGFDWLEDVLSDRVQAGPGGATGDVDADQARSQLSELAVAEWGSMRGYSRDRFSHWRTVDGCDARQTVLQRDGDDVELAGESCRVVAGTWYSAFDEVTLTDPGDIDIDHLVPLANAWRTGASGWDDDRRADFANDLDTPQLIAVSASSNRAKGDQDPSQWQPARSYWCQYSHDWVVVKHYWELSVTAAEHDALADMLDTCD